jgi:hypothetical protein
VDIFDGDTGLTFPRIDALAAVDSVCEPTEEICDGIDNNCNGEVDENVVRQCGVTDVGECEFGIETCSSGVWINCTAVFPTTETCNFLDDNCDGAVDEDFDLDLDTYTTCNGDCDDSDPAINPGASETCDGVDNNCDGVTDEGCCAASGYTLEGWACGGTWNPDTCCSDRCGRYSSQWWDVFCIDDVSDLGQGACDWGNGWFFYNGYSDGSFTCCNGTKTAGTSCP